MKAFTLRFLAVALLVAACGESREEERQDRIREICDGLVGQTVRFGEESLSSFALQPFDSCRTDWQELSANDVCAYDESTRFCLLGWNFVSNDPNACSARGCWYACMVHVSQADLQENGDTGEIPICASRFVKGQPGPVLR
jgi:hypothetical protein